MATEYNGRKPVQSEDGKFYMPLLGSEFNLPCVKTVTKKLGVDVTQIGNQRMAGPFDYYHSAFNYVYAIARAMEEVRQ